MSLVSQIDRGIPRNDDAPTLERDGGWFLDTQPARIGVVSWRPETATSRRP